MIVFIQWILRASDYLMSLIRDCVSYSFASEAKRFKFISF